MIKPATHVVEGCPVCGRPVAIRREYLGLHVVCRHCRGEFIATEDGQRASAWLEKCQRLLETADRFLAQWSAGQGGINSPIARRA